MNPEQPNPKNQRKTLYQAVKDASYVLKLRSGSKDLMDALIGHIPNDASSPVSPASVQLLMDRLGCEDRTIRYQIKKLIHLGLVENRCLANGRRHVQRNSAGDIVHVAGIDLSPLLDRAQEWANRAAAKKEAYCQRARLRFQISEKRGTLRRTLPTEHMPDKLRNLWTDLPSDLARLSLEALEAVVDKVDHLISTVTADRKNTAGQPEEFGRAYTTHQEQSESCNRGRSAEKPGPFAPSRQRSTCGLEHVSLTQAMMAAPEDWRIEMDRHGCPSWQVFASVAYERARALAISPSAWSLAQNAVGPNGAAIIVMLADAKSRERGGPIRSVGGWVRRMAERTDVGTANLHRTLFGLLHQETDAC